MNVAALVGIVLGVRRVAGDQPFAMAHAPKLLDDLSGQIEDADDRGARVTVTGTDALRRGTALTVGFNGTAGTGDRPNLRSQIVISRPSTPRQSTGTGNRRGSVGRSF